MSELQYARTFQAARQIQVNAEPTREFQKVRDQLSKKIGMEINGIIYLPQKDMEGASADEILRQIAKERNWTLIEKDFPGYNQKYLLGIYSKEDRVMLIANEVELVKQVVKDLEIPESEKEQIIQAAQKADGAPHFELFGGYVPTSVDGNGNIDLLNQREWRPETHFRIGLSKSKFDPKTTEDYEKKYKSEEIAQRIKKVGAAHGGDRTTEITDPLNSRTIIYVRPEDGKIVEAEKAIEVVMNQLKSEVGINFTIAQPPVLEKFESKEVITDIGKQEIQEGSLMVILKDQENRTFEIKVEFQIVKTISSGTSNILQSSEAKISEVNIRISGRDSELIKNEILRNQRPANMQGMKDIPIDHSQMRYAHPQEPRVNFSYEDIRKPKAVIAERFPVEKNQGTRKKLAFSAEIVKPNQGNNVTKEIRDSLVKLKQITENIISPAKVKKINSGETKQVTEKIKKKESRNKKDSEEEKNTIDKKKLGKSQELKTRAKDDKTRKNMQLLKKKNGREERRDAKLELKKQNAKKPKNPQNKTKNRTKNLEIGETKLKKEGLRKIKFEKRKPENSMHSQKTRSRKLKENKDKTLKSKEKEVRSRMAQRNRKSNEKGLNDRSKRRKNQNAELRTKKREIQLRFKLNMSKKAGEKQTRRKIREHSRTGRIRRTQRRAILRTQNSRRRIPKELYNRWLLGGFFKKKRQRPTFGRSMVGN